VSVLDIEVLYSESHPARQKENVQSCYIMYPCALNMTSDCTTMSLLCTVYTACDLVNHAVLQRRSRLPSG
jgi:hypothetical protein